uniref:Uncharacterized protein n=1 Tax=viral metagenome TaxID=1070528 RepID=A0A6M3K389_9ZZZZ
MSDELRLGIVLSFSKSSASIKKAFHIDVDVTGDAYESAVQAIGTSEEQLAQGADLGTPGYVLVKNLDATNYVEIGSTTGVYDIKLLAGEVSLWHHNSATIYAKANTSSVNVEYTIIEL